MKRVVSIVTPIVLMVCVVVFLTTFLLFQRMETHSWWDDPWASDKYIGKGPVQYTYFPIDENYITWIIPLGKVGVPQHPIPTDHIYFATDKSEMIGLLPAPYEVRAPAAGYIVHIQKFKWSELQTGREYDDYSFHILHTNTFMTFLGHVYDPAEHILQLAGELQYGDNLVWIRVEAGEVIGRATGGDMGTYNKEVTLNFIRPERYEPLMLHTVCPLDYFEPNLRERLYDKVLRKGEPTGGKIDYDQPGRLIGNWFLQGSPVSLLSMNWAPQLSFAYSVYDSAEIQIGFSEGLEVPQKFLSYNAYKVVNGPDPAAVNIESGRATYWLVAEGAPEVKLTLLVQMEKEDTIKIEAFDGWVENPGFTSQAKYYTR